MAWKCVYRWWVLRTLSWFCKSWVRPNPDYKRTIIFCKTYFVIVLPSLKKILITFTSAERTKSCTAILQFIFSEQLCNVYDKVFYFLLHHIQGTKLQRGNFGGLVWLLKKGTKLQRGLFFLLFLLHLSLLLFFIWDISQLPLSILSSRIT